MSLKPRDYFAAHAPMPPPAWFEPKMPPRPENKWGHSSSSMRFDNHNYALEYSNRHGGSPVNLNLEAQQEHDAEIPKQRMVQWAWHWAKMMMVERGE